MSNTKEETFQKLDKIRQEYSSVGDVIVRAAIQYIMEYGVSHISNEMWIAEQLAEIDEQHEVAEKNGTKPFISREAEKGIVTAAAKIAAFHPSDIIMYLQRKLWYNGNDISYDRGLELLRNCLSVLSEDFDFCNLKSTIQSIGFTDTELEKLGFGHLTGDYKA